MKINRKNEVDDWKKAQKTLNAEIEALSKLTKQKTNFLKALEILKNCQGVVIISGVGKSAHIGHKIAATLNSLGKRSVFLDSLHALHGDMGFVGLNDVFLGISYSGRSKEVIQLAHNLKKEFNIKVISLTGNPNSSLGKISDVVLKIEVKKEGSPLNLAPMASTTATLVLGDMLAAALVDGNSFEKKEFARFHPAGRLGLETKKISDLQINKPPLVNAEDSFKNGLKVITNYKKGITGVVNKAGKLIGVVSDGDVRRYVMKNHDLSQSKIKDAMSKKPKIISHDQSLSEALQMMEDHKITALFIVEKGYPKGLIHMHDILDE